MAGQSLNSRLTSGLDKGKLFLIAQTLPHMPASCKHPQVRVVAREEDAEFVVCQMCGEVFDAAEFADILNDVNEEGAGSDSVD